jgi:hypothetical protein
MTFHFTVFGLKATTLALAAIGAAAIAADPTVKVAIIVSIPPTISAFMWGWVNHKKISTVEVNTNNTLTQLREQIVTLLSENKDLSTRADRAEGRTEGDQSREEKQKEIK